ncbi:hypothetical protein KBC70_02235 [Candidatus Woesebacteria bacterium]|nr:hypothetical protein [Candidatus Woesebacteria bacterium]
MPKENWKKAALIVMLSAILGLETLCLSLFGNVSFIVGLVWCLIIMVIGFALTFLYIKLLEAMGYTILYGDKIDQQD